MAALIGAPAIASCDGPKREAGARQDKAVANAFGALHNRPGSRERLGEASDKADHAAAKARDAQGDAIKQQDREINSDADTNADRPEEQAEAIRCQARNQVRVLDQQAASG